MKSQITKAFDEHSEHFDLLIRSVASKFQPLWIFCFSQDISFQMSKGNFKGDNLQSFGTYSLLVVTEAGTRIDHEVQDFVNHIFKLGKITIICHGRENIFDAIEKNNRFFIEVFTKSELLYAHDGIIRHWSELSHDYGSTALKARNRMKHHLSLAEGFLSGANICLMSQQYNVSVFMLHQVVEQCCIGLVRVFLSYRSEFHNIGRLLSLCTSFSNIPYNWFFTGRQHEQHLFDILAKSYSQARYGKDFLIDEIDAQCLFEKISAFVKITRDMCERKIGELEQAYSQPIESEVQNG
jgi:uncharacterized protein